MSNLYQRNSLHNRKTPTWGEAVGLCVLAALAVPLLALLAFGISLFLAALGSLVMLAVVNWGLVTLGSVLGFTVHTVTLWGAFKLCYISMTLAGIFGGVRAANSITNK